MAKPVLKWVGGKRQLLGELTNRLPNSNIKHYIEPFFGGGALFFEIWERVESAHLSDSNFGLMGLYSAIKNTPHRLIGLFDEPPFNINSPEAFLEVKALYNDTQTESLVRAASFLYLNKTGFNGLFRVNKKGMFNVPYGKNPKANICDMNIIMDAHNAFQIAQLSTRSFHTVKFDFSEELMEGKNPNDFFVYFDPPYVPVTDTANFTSYTADGFGYQHQVDLKELCDFLTNKGIRWMQSNSYTPQVLDLYKNYVIDEVKARRNVNSDATKRGKVSEAIIRNYK